MLIYGPNAILEALRAGRVIELRVAERTDGRVAELIAAAERAGVAVRRVTSTALDRAVAGGRHRHHGAIADVHGPASVTLEELVAHTGRPPLVVVLDGIEDP